MAATPLMSVAEVAAYVGVPPKTIYNWRTKHTGPRGIRVGRHVRYRQADVDAWLDRQADDPEPVVTPAPPPAVRRRRTAPVERART